MQLMNVSHPEQKSVEHPDLGRLCLENFETIIRALEKKYRKMGGHSQLTNQVTQKIHGIMAIIYVLKNFSPVTPNELEACMELEAKLERLIKMVWLPDKDHTASLQAALRAGEVEFDKPEDYDENNEKYISYRC